MITRLLSLTLGGALTFGALACGGGSKPDVPPTQFLTQDPTPTPTPTPTGTDEPVATPSPEPSETPSPEPSPTPSPSPSPSPLPSPTPTSIILPGICGTLYDMHSVNRHKLPNFDQLEPMGLVILNNFDIADRSYKQVFPGMPTSMTEFYAIRFRGKILAATAGDYEFTLRSDDGSRLLIDGKAVVDNDGLHTWKRVRSGTAHLTAGSHDFTLEYFQGPRFRLALQLFWRIPGSNDSVIIPASAFEGYGYSAFFCY